MNEDNLPQVVEKFDLEADLARAAELRAEIDKLKPLKDEMEHVRFRIQTAMAQNHSKRTDPVHGLFAVRSEKKTLVIRDEDEVIAWLSANDFDPTDYLKLDNSMVTKIAEGVLKQDGELIPGTDMQYTEYITLKTEKTT
jgi:hypothetical protein